MKEGGKKVLLKLDSVWILSSLIFCFCFVSCFSFPPHLQNNIGLQKLFKKKYTSKQNFNTNMFSGFWKIHALFILKVQMFSYFDFIEFDFD